MTTRIPAFVITVLLCCASSVAAQSQSFKECMRFGPEDPPDPYWGVLSHEAKSKICRQQRAIEKREERERGGPGFFIPVDPAPAVPALPPAPQPVVVATQPRLTEDRKTLVLLEEIREPREKRRPEISISADSSIRTRQIRISGQGILAIPTIDIICGADTRSLPLGTFAQTPDRNLATYQVPEDLATVILKSSSCQVAVAGARLSIPRDLLSVVWEKASSK